MNKDVLVSHFSLSFCQQYRPMFQMFENDKTTEFPFNLRSKQISTL